MVFIVLFGGFVMFLFGDDVSSFWVSSRELTFLGLVVFSLKKIY